MRPWRSIICVLAVVLPLAAIVGAPAPAQAERWWGSGDICMDLDSVHIVTNNGTRYVAFRQQLCKGSGILWWAIADSDCAAAHGNDRSFDLYVYDADARQWRTAFDYFAFPDTFDDEYANAGVACNWAHPSLF